VGPISNRSKYVPEVTSVIAQLLTAILYPLRSNPAPAP